MQSKNSPYIVNAGIVDKNNRLVRLQLISDLHLNSYTGQYAEAVRIRRHPDADLVVVAGDVGDGPSCLGQFRNLLGAGPIVMVAGNHDVMGLWWHNGIEVLKAEARKHGIVLLENEEWQFKGIRFLGCTLWTDYELYGPQHVKELIAKVPGCLPEYRAIGVASKLVQTKDLAPTYFQHQLKGSLNHSTIRSLSAIDVIDRHKASRAWLLEQLQDESDQPTVVLTHHLPHRKSIDPKYLGKVSTGGFASNCDELFVQPKKPVYWLHGHTHHSVEYVENETSVMCRPMGYPRTSSAEGLTENLAFDALGPLLCVLQPATNTLP